MCSVRFSVCRWAEHGSRPRFFPPNRVPQTLHPLFRGGLGVRVTLSTWHEAARAQGFEARINFLGCAAEIRIIPIAEAEDGELQILQSRRGIRFQPGPEIGRV